MTNKCQGTIIHPREWEHYDAFLGAPVTYVISWYQSAVAPWDRHGLHCADEDAGAQKDKVAYCQTVNRPQRWHLNFDVLDVKADVLSTLPCSISRKGSQCSSSFQWRRQALITHFSAFLLNDQPLRCLPGMPGRCLLLREYTHILDMGNSVFHLSFPMSCW